MSEIPTPPELTPSQAAVYRLVVQGYTSEEIARKISRSQKTVENHRFAISKRLKTESVAALVMYHYEFLVLPPLESELAILKGEKGEA